VLAYSSTTGAPVYSKVGILLPLNLGEILGRSELQSHEGDFVARKLKKVMNGAKTKVVCFNEVFREQRP
jgi:hypothetical protein